MGEWGGICGDILLCDKISNREESWLEVRAEAPEGSEVVFFPRWLRASGWGGVQEAARPPPLCFPLRHRGLHCRASWLCCRHLGAAACERRAPMTSSNSPLPRQLCMIVDPIKIVQFLNLKEIALLMLIIKIFMCTYKFVSNMRLIIIFVLKIEN